jgi:hypothetical protein
MISNPFVQEMAILSLRKMTSKESEGRKKVRRQEEVPIGVEPFRFGRAETKT